MRLTAAAMVVLLVSLAPTRGSAQPAHQPVPQPAPHVVTLEAQAQQRYHDGRAHYHTGEYLLALEDFRASLQMANSPNTRMYLGRTLRQMGRLAEAFTTLDRAASEAGAWAETEPRYGPTRDTARTEAEALRSMVGFLVVRVLPPTEGIEVRVNGEPVPRAAWEVPTAMAPGDLVAVAHGEGFRDATGTVTLTAGQQATLDLTIEPLPPPARTPGTETLPGTVTPDRPRVQSGTDTPTVAPHGNPVAVRSTVPPPGEARATRWRTAGWVLGAVGLASLLAGAGFHLLAWNEYATLQGMRPADQGLIDSGETHQTIAAVAYAAGAGLLVTGTVFLLLGRRHGETVPRTTVALDPAGGVSVVGTF